jgi:D-alanyl-lipoteichoic acid acyltransferase DltB (MBOAT superfamily)
MMPYDLVAPDWPYLLRAATATATVASTGAILFSISPHLRPGSLRIFVSLIAVALNCWASALFHPENEVVSVAMAGLVALWLGSFKAMGWALNRGPLAQPLTFVQFITIYMMPITPISSLSKNDRHPRSKRGEPALQALQDTVVKLVLLGLILIILRKFDENIPLLIKEATYALALYAFVSLMMAPLSAAVTAVLQLDIAPYFDRPYLSSSLTDYWSRRWNLNVTHTLRFLVYEPICEGRVIKANKKQTEGTSPLRRAVAACTTFLVSGAIHELIIFYVCGRFSGSWLMFFTLQGPLLVLESLGRRYMRQNKMMPLIGMLNKIPHWLRILITLSVLLTLGDWYFFPHVLAMGIPQNVASKLYDILIAPWLGF